MGGDGPMHRQVGSAGESMVLEETPGKLHGALGIGTIRSESSSPPHLEQHGGSRHRRPDSAEAPTTVSPEVQHAEVEPGWRLDPDCSRAAHRGPAASRVCTRSLSSVIASSSRGPAVLSTMICSRANSLRISSEGRR